jgi:hypothetical protein
MISGSIHEKVNLSKLIQTNSRISAIKNLAFQIKIKSINEQILSIKNNMHDTGFQVVSREFIFFSKVFEQLANDMQSLMNTMLPNIAHKIKNEKMIFQKRKAIHLSKNLLLEGTISNQEVEWMNSLRENSKSLSRLLKKSELLSLQGNIIFMQSKITGAYIRESEQGELLMSLTNELGDIMTEVKNNISMIRKIWEL